MALTHYRMAGSLLVELFAIPKKQRDVATNTILQRRQNILVASLVKTLWLKEIALQDGACCYLEFGHYRKWWQTIVGLDLSSVKKIKDLLHKPLLAPGGVGSTTMTILCC